MADIRLCFNEETQQIDWAFTTSVINDVTVTDIDTSNDLETCVILRLFTNRRAETSWNRTENKEGFWYDAYQENGRKVGSRLWQLWHLPVTDKETYEARATDYVREALQDMLDDHMCEKIDITCTLVSSKRLNISVTITKGSTRQNFSYLWSTVK